MDAAWPSKTFVTYITVWYHSPQDHDLNVKVSLVNLSLKNPEIE